MATLPKHISSKVNKEGFQELIDFLYVSEEGRSALVSLIKALVEEQERAVIQCSTDSGTDQEARTLLVNKLRLDGSRLLAKSLESLIQTAIKPRLGA